MAIALASGAGLLVLPDPALADPPHWAKANGHRAKHAGSGKHGKHHRKYHRHERDLDHGDSDEILDWDDSDGATYPASSFREADIWHHRATRQSVFHGGVCIPRPSGAEAGAVLGQGLASQVTGGNATSTALGGVLGAVLGSQFGGGASAADEDCTYQVLEDAADRERIAWEDTASATRYQLTPVRSFYRSGRVCRDLVTQGVHRGKLREVRRTACRHRDGAWHIVD
ncbi:MAG: RT0821/Lpp0805 family surface protein [Gammaproteobacteria bacterium]